MADNVLALLRARGQTQADLAMWCRKSDVWVSQGLSLKRSLKVKDLDRIAEFFGIATYQLFQPGISALTERRSGRDRRNGRDRRVSALNLGGTFRRVVFVALCLGGLSA